MNSSEPLLLTGSPHILKPGSSGPTVLSSLKAKVGAIRRQRLALPPAGGLEIGTQGQVRHHSLPVRTKPLPGNDSSVFKLRHVSSSPPKITHSGNHYLAQQNGFPFVNRPKPSEMDEIFYSDEIPDCEMGKLFPSNAKDEHEVEKKNTFHFMDTRRTCTQMPDSQESTVPLSHSTPPEMKLKPKGERWMKHHFRSDLDMTEQQHTIHLHRATAIKNKNTIDYNTTFMSPRQHEQALLALIGEAARYHKEFIAQETRRAEQALSQSPRSSISAVSTIGEDLGQLSFADCPAGKLTSPKPNRHQQQQLGYLFLSPKGALAKCKKMYCAVSFTMVKGYTTMFFPSSSSTSSDDGDEDEAQQQVCQVKKSFRSSVREEKKERKLKELHDHYSTCVRALSRARLFDVKIKRLTGDEMEETNDNDAEEATPKESPYASFSSIPSSSHI